MPTALPISQPHRSEPEPTATLRPEDSLPRVSREIFPLAVMSHYLSLLPPRYLLQAHAVAAQLGPLPETTRQSVAIPVAAHEEGATLLQTLRAYSKQSLAYERFELALFLNYPTGSDPTPSLSALEAWSKEQPKGMRVVCAVQEAPTGSSIGYLRKVLNDAIVHRVVSRNLEADHLLLRSDADTVATHPDHLAQHLHLHATRSQRMLAVKGKVTWDPVALASDPLSAWGVIVWQISERVLAAQLPNPLFGGVNFSMRASTYATLGGYNPALQLGEDVELGRRVQQLGQSVLYPKSIIDGGPRSGCTTSARRIVALREFGDPPVTQWESKSVGFDIHNQKIRGLQIPTPLTRAEFQARMEHPDFALNAAEVAFRTIAHLTAIRSLRSNIQGVLTAWLGLRFGKEVYPAVYEIENPKRLHRLMLDWYDKNKDLHWAP